MAGAAGGKKDAFAQKPEIAQAASEIALIPEVRAALLEFQRNLRAKVVRAILTLPPKVRTRNRTSLSRALFVLEVIFLL